MKTLIIDETKEPELYEKLSQSENVKTFETPLAAFATQEAEFRINKLVKEDGIPTDKVKDCIDNASYDLEQYLTYAETALNYDGIDETIHKSIDETLDETD